MMIVEVKVTIGRKHHWEGAPCSSRVGTVFRVLTWVLVTEGLLYDGSFQCAAMLHPLLCTCVIFHVKQL